MPIVKTEIEWPYKPEGFLEVTLRRVGTGYILTLQEGRAKAVLDQPLDPVPPDLIERILRQVRASLDARQLLLHQSYRLEEGPRIVQHRPEVSVVVEVKALREAAARLRAVPQELEHRLPKGPVLVGRAFGEPLDLLLVRAQAVLGLAVPQRGYEGL